MSTATKETKQVAQSPEQAELARLVESRKKNKSRERSARELELRRVLGAAKFRELGEARMERALKIIGHVGNLSNKNAYTYTPEQANKIVTALTNAVANVKAAFQGGESGVKGFTL